MEKNHDKKRILWMDILNIVACIGVILLHVSNRQLIHFESTTINFYWGAFTHSISLWPVPVFIMLSGSNLLCRKSNSSRGGVKTFYKRRFLRTGIPFIAWSIIYTLYYHPDLSCQQYVSKFVNGDINSHMWFFIPLFSLYLCIPFLDNMVKGMTERLQTLFLLIVSIFLVILPFTFKFLEIEYFKHKIFPLGENLFCYAILGYCIYQNNFLQKYRHLLYSLAVAMIILSFTAITMALPSGLDRSFVIGYTSPFCFVTSLAVFILFKNIDWETVISRIHISPAVFTNISSCSLGIYLIHGGIRSFSNHHNLILTNPYIGAILLYVLSLSIVWTMKKIPILKYIVP